MTHEQHQNVSSLVSDLVQMAEATRRLPEVERELADMRSASSRDGDTIARLERKLMDRSAEIDELRAKLRSVEAERDDAGFRQLEAEDKSNVLRNVVEGVLSTLGETLGMTDGTDQIRVVRMTEVARGAWLEHQVEQRRQLEDQEARREEEARIAAEQRAFAQSESGERAVDPTIVHTQDNANSTLGANDSALSAESKSIEDQSEVPPTVQRPISPEPVISTTATSQDGVTSSEPPKSSLEALGRYAGKKYYDHPYYVSEESWVANGGTLEDYHWNPAVNA